jgi:hypothetical protein
VSDRVKIKEGFEVERHADGGVTLWLEGAIGSVGLRLNPDEILALGKTLEPSIEPILMKLLLAARVAAGLDICRAAEEIVRRTLPGRSTAIEALRDLATSLRKLGDS